MDKEAYETDHHDWEEDKQKNNKKLKIGAKKHYGFCWNCGVTHSFGKCTDQEGTT